MDSRPGGSNCPNIHALRLLMFPVELQEAVSHDTISTTHAEALARLADQPLLLKEALAKRGVEEYETLKSLLDSVDLGFVQHLLEGCYHQNGAGRPPRNPLGLFKAHLAKRYLRISSLRELERRLWIDERLRAIC